jgi:hypothetical protein
LFAKFQNKRDGEPDPDDIITDNKDRSKKRHKHEVTEKSIFTAEE